VGGGSADEFDVLGVPLNRRGAITNEYLEIIHALWTQDEVTYDGKFVSLDKVHGVHPYVTPNRAHPPVWVGGRSDAAMRRAVRFEAEWHPNAMTHDWLRDEGMPRMREIAAEMNGRMPALDPRVKVDLRDAPLDDEGRTLGSGSLDQIRGDMQLLERLGAEHVLFDWYMGGDRMDTGNNDERAWRMLSVLAEQVIDVRGQRLR
jgi:hypothetical protein